MREIPIAAAKEIADKYGYDQIIIIGRVVDTPETSGWEHVTTYGKDNEHCSVAAQIGNYFKYVVMKWPREDDY